MTCCEEKINKGKDLEKKNNVVKGLKLWETGHWKEWKIERERKGDEWKTEKEKVMRRVWLCKTKRWWVTKRKNLPIENRDGKCSSSCCVAIEEELSLRWSRQSEKEE